MRRQMGHAARRGTRRILPAMSGGDGGRRSLLCLAGLSLLGVFLLSVAWEFGLEDSLGPLLGIGGEPESVRDHWEYVIASTLFAGIAMLFPTALSMRIAAERERITGRLRESEQKFRGIVENSPASISLKDADGRYFLTNRQFEILAGATSDKIKGKRSDEIFPEDFARSGMEHDREVLRTKRASAREEEVHVAGRDYFFLTAKFPIEDIGGEVVAIGAIHTDITERKRSEKRVCNSNESLEHRTKELEKIMEHLVHARDQAEAADHAKSEFLAMMSHELRTPLNAIIGFSEIMKTETLGPIGSVKYQEFADDIYASGHHLLGLINDILDLSKIESGKASLCEEDIEIHEMLRSALTLVKVIAKQGEVALELNCADGLPMLCADRRKLKQILTNLLSNGIKFTPAGGRVLLKAWCSADNGHVFQIVDTGIGIALEEIPRAMAPFQQIDSRLGRKHEGTGLGLPLTKALIELHGGSFDLQSEVGVGTKVTIRFPASRVVVPEVGSGQARAS